MIPTTKAPISNQQKIELIHRIENYLTSKYSVSCGRDSNETEYDSIFDFWIDRNLIHQQGEEEDDDIDGNELEYEQQQEEEGPSSSSSWYKQSHEYWQNTNHAPPTIDGMLGGFAILSDRDIQASRDFILYIIHHSKYCNSLKEEEEEREIINDDNNNNDIENCDKIDSSHTRYFANTRSCECGAGIGRITKLLLLPLGISNCDLVETSPRLIEYAPVYIGKEEDVKRCNFICQGLQDFHPSVISSSSSSSKNNNGCYDIIWIQWVIGYLTDWDLVSFLRRMGKSLKPGGLIIIKDNTCNEMAFLADCGDSDITRSYQYLMAIVKESGMRIAKDDKGEELIRWQDDFPDDIWPVPMIALENDIL